MNNKIPGSIANPNSRQNRRAERTVFSTNFILVTYLTAVFSDLLAVQNHLLTCFRESFQAFIEFQGSSVHFNSALFWTVMLNYENHDHFCIPWLHKNKLKIKASWLFRLARTKSAFYHYSLQILACVNFTDKKANTENIQMIEIRKINFFQKIKCFRNVKEYSTTMWLWRALLQPYTEINNGEV